MRQPRQPLEPSPAGPNMVRASGRTREAGAGDKRRAEPRENRHRDAQVGLRNRVAAARGARLLEIAGETEHARLEEGREITSIARDGAPPKAHVDERAPGG